MRKIVVFIVFFFLIDCCILSVPCKIDTTVDGKAELNVDLIYPYRRVPLDKITLTVGAQTNNEMYTSPLVAGLSSHQWPQQGLNCQHVGRSQYSTSREPRYREMAIRGNRLV